MSTIVGMTVRDKKGGLGRITAASSGKVRLAWMHESVFDPQIEDVSVSNLARRKQVQVLTFDAGWVPLAQLAETSPRATSVADDLTRLLSEAESLEEKKSSKKKAAAKEMPAKKKLSGKDLEKKATEKKKGSKGANHNPFKTKSRLGPGPRSGQNHQTKSWKCKCNNPYRCLCRNGSRTKIIRIKRSYKKPYNKEYKAWRKNQSF